MNHYPEPESHIGDKVKVVLNFIDILLDFLDFIALKTEVDNLNINKLVNVPISLNNSKTK